MKKVMPIIMLLLVLSLSLSAFFISIANAVEDSWTTLAEMPTARSGLGVAVVDEKIYALGGGYGLGPLGNNEMYDPATDTWTTKNPILTPRSQFGVAVVENKIYLIGGGVSGMPTTSLNEVYDPSTDTWETKTQMPTSRTYIVANEVDGKIYVMAGCTFPHPSFPTLCNRTEIYDPSTDSWTTGASMPDFEGLGMPEHIAFSVLDNKIYVVFEETLYIYNADTDSWSYGADLPTRLRGTAACFTTGLFAPKRLHVLGLDLHYVYNPETDNWTSATPIPNSRYHVQLGVVDDILYAIGGGIGDPIGIPSASFESQNINEKYIPVGYIPEFPSWIILPLLITATLLIIICKQKLPKNR